VVLIAIRIAFASLAVAKAWGKFTSLTCHPTFGQKIIISNNFPLLTYSLESFIYSLEPKCIHNAYTFMRPSSPTWSASQLLGSCFSISSSVLLSS
jgi:hypothetical protein